MFPFPKNRLAFVGWVALAALAGGAAGADVVGTSEVFLVGPRVEAQGGSSVAADRAGGWAVAWGWYDDEWNPAGRLRRIDRDGRPVEGTLRDLRLVAPSIALAGDGSGVVVGTRQETGRHRIEAVCIDDRGRPRHPGVRVDQEGIDPDAQTTLGAMVSANSAGRFVVVWREATFGVEHPGSLFYRRFDADCAPSGPPRAIVGVGQIEEIYGAPFTVAMRPDASFVVAWRSGAPASPLLSQLFDRSGDAASDPVRVDQDDEMRAQRPSIAIGAAGTYAVAWLGKTNRPSRERVLARLFRSNGTPRGGEILLRTNRARGFRDVAVAAVEEAWVGSWIEGREFTDGAAVWARGFGEDGTIGDPAEITTDDNQAFDLDASALGGAEVAVSWNDANAGPGGTRSDLLGRRIALVPDPPACVPDENDLCLAASRFRVHVEWRDFQGRTGVARTHPLTADSGAFWFFGAENLEMLVKVIDACADFGHFWFYAAATTDVEYTITVTDMETGSSRSYFNPLGRASPAITDAEAFSTCP